LACCTAVTDDGVDDDRDEASAYRTVLHSRMASWASVIKSVGCRRLGRPNSVGASSLFFVPPLLLLDNDDNVLIELLNLLHNIDDAVVASSSDDDKVCG
jgi:hypothetical protein